MPWITICLLCDEKENKVLARGISLCSMKEFPIKKIGRELAYERAYLALTSGKNSEEIEKIRIVFPFSKKQLAPSFDIICSVLKNKDNFQFFQGPDWTFKSCINPFVTEFENSLLNKLIERKI